MLDLIGGNGEKIPVAPTVQQALESRNKKLDFEIAQFQAAIKVCKADIELNESLIADLKNGTMKHNTKELLKRLFVREQQGESLRS